MRPPERLYKVSVAAQWDTLPLYVVPKAKGEGATKATGWLPRKGNGSPTFQFYSKEAQKHMCVS
jgi:hypothetical protein